jgi:hypothetical protein
MNYHIWHLSYEQHVKVQLSLYSTWRFTLGGLNLVDLHIQLFVDLVMVQ